MARVFRPDRPFVFILRASSLSILFTTIIIYTQSIIQAEEFEAATLPFLKNLLSFDIRSALTFASFVAIDVVSVYQTLLFFRFFALCTRFPDYVLLATADIVVSMLCVIIILPALLATTIFLTASGRSQSIDMLLTTHALPQGLDLMFFSRVIAFQPSSADSDEEVMEKMRQAGWRIEAFRVVAAPAEPGESTLPSTLSQGNNLGTIIIQRKGRATASTLAVQMADLIKTDDRVTSVEVLDSYTDLYGADYILLRLDGRSSSHPSSIVFNYLDVLQSVNFLDADFLRFLQLKSMTVGENELYYSEVLRLNFNDTGLDSRDALSSCDGTTDRLDQELSAQLQKFAGCGVGLVLGPLAIGNIRAALNYSFSDEFMVPVLPLAISSLAATATIYYLALALVLAAPTGQLARRFLSDDLFRSHLFSVTWVYTLAVLAPFIVIFWYLFGA